MSMVIFYLAMSMSFYAGTRYEQVKQVEAQTVRSIGISK